MRATLDILHDKHRTISVEIHDRHISGQLCQKTYTFIPKTYDLVFNVDITLTHKKTATAH